MAEDLVVNDKGHLSRTKKNREGFYHKNESSQKHHKKDYKKTCRGAQKGFCGPKHQIHHIIPQTSIEESSADHDDPRFLEDVKWISKWSINNVGNLIGLPAFASYLRYFHRSNKKWRNLVADWFYSQVPMAPTPPQTFSTSPEGHPIHNPVSWGHVRYNEIVETQLTSRVWSEVKGQRKGHRVKANAIAGALTSLQGSLEGQLARPAATRATWENRAMGSSWYVPFTMAPVPNPIDNR